MHDDVETAWKLHQSGQLEEASRLYQDVLSSQGDDVDVLHRLGILFHQQGDYARAVALLERAVALEPSASVLHANLAETYRALGKLEHAVACCRTALRIAPEYPEALCNLGAALHGLGEHANAVVELRRAIALRPDFFAAHNTLGIALRETGETDEALDHFRRAVQIEPAFAMARTNLGQLLLSKGQIDEALLHCQEAVRLQPGVAALHHNVGNVLRATGSLIEARAAYLEALRLDPNLAEASLRLALVLHQEGQSASALPWLLRCVEIEPSNATFWEHLARLYDDLDEFEHSSPWWERLAAIYPQRADIRVSLGWSLHEQSRFAEAAEQYQAAASLRADWAMPIFNLGRLHEELGDRCEAESKFRKALAMQPNFVLPHAKLATLLGGELSEKDVHAIEQRLADETISQSGRASLLFALAHVFDARSDWERAAECLSDANRLALASNENRNRYVPADHEAVVDHIVHVFDDAYFSRVKAGGADSRRPVFVFGLPRSGTTLIEQILASHSEICGAGELRIVRKTFQEIPRAVGRADDALQCVASLDAAAIRRLAASHLEKLADIDRSSSLRIVDKMPENYIYLGFIASMFPNATLIHCRRDLRDTALSCWMTDFRAIRWANDPQHLASRFHQYVRLMNHWRRVLPVRLYEIDYHMTVNDLETVSRRLIEACGLSWEARCLEFHRTKRPVRTASMTQVRRPLYQHSLERWRPYRTVLASLFDALPCNVDG